MANDTISQIEINGTTYDLLDANTLSAVSALKERVSTLESSVDFSSQITVQNLQPASIKIGKCRYKTIFFMLDSCRLATALPSNETRVIANIPSQYAPKNEYVLTSFNCTNPTVGTAVNVMIKKNGEVIFRNFSNSSFSMSSFFGCFALYFL